MTVVIVHQEDESGAGGFETMGPFDEVSAIVSKTMCNGDLQTVTTHEGDKAIVVLIKDGTVQGGVRRLHPRGTSHVHNTVRLLARMIDPRWDPDVVRYLEGYQADDVLRQLQGFGYQDRQDDADVCGGRQQWNVPAGDDVR